MSYAELQFRENNRSPSVSCFPAVKDRRERRRYAPSRERVEKNESERSKNRLRANVARVPLSKTSLSDVSRRLIVSRIIETHFTRYDGSAGVRAIYSET